MTEKQTQQRGPLPSTLNVTSLHETPQRRQYVKLLNSSTPVAEISGAVNLVPVPSQPQDIYQTNNLKGEKVKMVSQSVYWLLITWEADGQNIYHMINAADISLAPNSNTLAAGKSILFRNGNSVMQATIVLVSEFKNYIENELRTLQQMAAHNLEHSGNRKAVLDNQAPEGERVIVARYNRPQYNQVINRPMTFDQQTQTDTRRDSTSSGNSELAMQIASLIEIQKHNEKQMNILIQQQNQILESTAANSRSIDALNRQLNQFATARVETITTTEAEAQQPVSYSYTYDNRDSSDNLIISEYTINDDQKSRYSMNEASNMSIRSDTGNIQHPAEKDTVIIEVGSKQQLKRNSNESNGMRHESVRNQILTEWDEDEEGEYVVLGEHKTRVLKEIFQTINWSSYRAATRKLLIALFPRETLASHSLTGRPSPAFHDRNRPAKDRLDQNIIADIVSTVVKYCNVPEGMVRTAITTKCADENKMSRQRMCKRKIEEDEDAENVHDPKYTTIKMENKENHINVNNS